MTTTQQPATLTQWRVDHAHSNVQFAVRHMMFTTVHGRFHDVDGTVRWDESDPSRSQVEVSIKAASIDTGVADRDAHLRSADFLDAEHFPELSFRSTRVEPAGGKRLRISGDLTIRGTTRPVVLEAIEEGRGKDPWGGQRAGFTASTSLDRREFGLNWNQALEAGGWLVGQEVKITLDMQLVRQD
jgi:polyisoprenoid-binding protein YceI